MRKVKVWALIVVMVTGLVAGIGFIPITEQVPYTAVEDQPLKVTQTFYPDADPEVSSVDGQVLHDFGLDGTSWAAIIGAGGSVSSDRVGNGRVLEVHAARTENMWRNLYRSIFVFDTSSLPPDCIIAEAVLSIYGYDKLDYLGILPDINVYSSNPASNTKLVPDDYDSFGSTPFSTAISYADWDVSGYNDFVLNSDGKNSISKGGVSKFGMRSPSYDVSGTPPHWTSGKATIVACYFAEKGAGYKPKLVVTYTVAVEDVTLTIETIGRGTTDPAPGSWEYTAGSEVLVRAIPTAGWQFDHWEGSIAGIENPITFTIAADIAITAVFSEIIVPPEEYAVTISVIGEGMTDPMPGAYIVTHGVILKITAYPAEGWRFSHWQGDISGTANPVNIEVLGNMPVVAVFAEISPPLLIPAWTWPLIGGVIVGVIVVIIALSQRKRK